MKQIYFSKSIINANPLSQRQGDDANVLYELKTLHTKVMPTCRLDSYQALPAGVRRCDVICIREATGRASVGRGGWPTGTPPGVRP